MKQTIKRWDNGKVIYECEADSLKEAVEKAVSEGVSLAYADLSKADLSCSNLFNSNLSHSRLFKANFTFCRMDKKTKDYLIDNWLMWEIVE